MARKRKLDAGLPPLEEEVSVAPKPAMGGMWAGSAMNLLKQRIEDTHGSLVSGILNGTVALTLDPCAGKHHTIHDFGFEGRVDLRFRTDNYE